MSSYSIKARIILPLIMAGVVLFGTASYLVGNLEVRQKQHAVVQQAEALKLHLSSILDSKAEVMEASLRFIAQDKHLLAALQAGDRKTLLALSAPIYERLHQQHNVTHFYFHDARRINLLRTHQPERFGDLINRHTALGAEKSAAVFSGIELGPLGTFTLRSVLPVLNNGELIGYIELGQEIDNLIQDMHAMFNAELFLLVDKQHLVQSNWEAGMKMLGRTHDWNALSSTVLVSQSLPDAPVYLLNQISVTQANPDIQIRQDIDFQNHSYWAATIPVNDADGHQSATLVMLHDMTHLNGQSRSDFILYATIFALIGLGILAFFSRILRRIERELIRSEISLQQMVTKFRTLFESSSDAIMLLTDKGFFDCNQATLTMFNCPTREDFIGKHPSELSPARQPDGQDSMTLANRHIAQTFQSGSHQFEWIHRRLDGHEFPAEVLLTAMELEGGTALEATVRDISERKKAQREIEQALHVQRVLDSILNIALPPLTLNEVLLKALKAVLSIPAFSLQDKGSIFLALKGEQKLEMMAQRNLPDALLHACAFLPFGRCLCGKAAATREIVFFNHVNEQHEISYEGITPHGHYCIPIISEGQLLGVLNIYVDADHVADENEKQALKTVADTLAVVIERKISEEKLQKMAHNDPLTGLPNRSLFHDRLEQGLAMTQRHQQQLAVMFMDLDHFKEINDIYGHDIGDLLLRETANRLLGCVRKSDTVARMGGDEFTIILTESNSPENAEHVAKNILNALLQPFELNGTRCNVGCSIGIALYPKHGRDSETLLKNADTAMYQAKITRNTYRFYDESL
ncbi:MAG: diguanylate cyclase [Gallionella sp.]|nr:diguanylate cyclase [Gallionella sp.]MDP1939463.1 diguanylate cyclase [Gallionella sp.]